MPLIAQPEISHTTFAMPQLETFAFAQIHQFYFCTKTFLSENHHQYFAVQERAAIR
jgi:hypothetical protein